MTLWTPGGHNGKRARKPEKAIRRQGPPFRVAVAVAAWDMIDDPCETAIFNVCIGLGMSGLLAGRYKMTGAYQPDVRNQLCKLALDQPWTHILFLDQDMIGFDPKAVIRMVERNVPIVSAWYCRRVPPHLPVHCHFQEDGKAPRRGHVKREEYDLWRGKALKEVFGVGGGCLLVERRVIEALMPYPFQFLPLAYDLMRSARAHVDAVAVGEGMHDSFAAMKAALSIYEEDTKATETGWFKGEDISFSIRAREKGYRSFVDGSVMCGHVSVMAATIAEYLSCPTDDKSLETTDVDRDKEAKEAAEAPA